MNSNLINVNDPNCSSYKANLLFKSKSKNNSHDDLEIQTDCFFGCFIPKSSNKKSKQIEENPNEKKVQKISIIEKNIPDLNSWNHEILLEFTLKSFHFKMKEKNNDYPLNSLFIYNIFNNNEQVFLSAKIHLDLELYPHKNLLSYGDLEITRKHFYEKFEKRSKCLFERRKDFLDTYFFNLLIIKNKMRKFCKFSLILDVFSDPHSLFQVYYLFLLSKFNFS